MSLSKSWSLVLLVFALKVPFAWGAEEVVPFSRTQDVIYGHKYGTALTLDVFKPKEYRNGLGIIFVVSGGWYSSHEAINTDVLAEFLKRGYTVFPVVHGSQPKFTIPEIVEDMHRAVRYIRFHAKDYQIDPDRLGIVGGSAGGHLSLMIACAGASGDPNAKDPVDRDSSRVQAVGCYFPPTDFLNYGKSGRDFLQALEEELAPFRAPFDFQELDSKTHQFRLITDATRRLEIAKEISPITHVTPDDPPTLMLHGDADTLVAIQQSQLMQDALESVEVPVKLVVKPGQGHGWLDWIGDLAIIADWFDEHLLNNADN